MSHLNIVILSEGWRSSPTEVEGSATSHTCRICSVPFCLEIHQEKRHRIPHIWLYDNVCEVVTLSAETEKLFRSLLKELRPLFKDAGFRTSGQNFILESAECWVIVNFQKSRWTDREETTFYVNVAACAKRWSGIHGKPAEKIPSYVGCDWQWRVEQFAPDKNIKQWTLRDEASLQQTLLYLRNLFQAFVIPATRTMTTEAELLKHIGGFEYPQLKTRTVVLAATNQVDALRQTVATLMGKFGSAEGTQIHFELLRAKYPEAMRSIEL